MICYFYICCRDTWSKQADYFLALILVQSDSVMRREHFETFDCVYGNIIWLQLKSTWIGSGIDIMSEAGRVGPLLSQRPLRHVIKIPVLSCRYGKTLCVCVVMHRHKASLLDVGMS